MTYILIIAMFGVAALLDYPYDDDSEDDEVEIEDSAAINNEATTQQPKQTRERYINRLWSRIWSYMGSYTVSEDEYSQWYLMDEVGTSVSHSATPNCRCAAFMFQPPATTVATNNTPAVGGISKNRPVLPPPLVVSILWPIEKISAGDVLTRDYLPSVPVHHPSRCLRLLAYTHPFMSGKPSYDRLVSCVYDAVIQSSQSALLDRTSTIDSSHTSNTPTSSTASSVQVDWQYAVDKLKSLHSNSSGTAPILRVFCDRPDHLNKEFIHRTDRIQIVDTPVEADVLYLIDHTLNEPVTSRTGSTAAGSTTQNQIVKKGIIGDEYIKTGKIINQFWWNGMIVSKEHLASTIKSAHIKSSNNSAGSCPAWLPTSYDLSVSSELAHFVQEFTLAERTLSNSNSTTSESTGYSDNIWILKRYRGKQSVDYPITSNLSCALRHMDSAPRLACKYIKTPTLYQGRKFDLRFYVLVHSLEPLVLYRHHLFIVRCANNQYSIDDLENYQKHFTLMSMLDDPTIGQVRGMGTRADPNMTEMMQYFNTTYGGKVVYQDGSKEGTSRVIQNWEVDLQSCIDHTFRQVFESVRAVYASEPAHPSGQPLHPNAGWSLNQPNACPARAMFGVDVMLELNELSSERDNISSQNADMNGQVTNVTHSIQPVILEVQWAPDCAQAVKQCPSFWDEILSALYLDDFSSVKAI